MDLSFEQRLLRFLVREEQGEVKNTRDLRALSAEERVLEGECIQGARLVVAVAGRFEFEIEDDSSKFREGDALAVGDGIDFAQAMPLAYRGFDPKTGVLTLRRDPFSREEPLLRVGAEYTIDRRPLGLRGRLQEVVRAAFGESWLVERLMGRGVVAWDEGRRARAVERLRATGLNGEQVAAGAAAIATESLALVQGPPGTGKTRLLAEVARALAEAGCRVVLSAFTHRAVDNALMAIVARSPDLDVVKVQAGGKLAPELEQAGVRAAHPRRGRLPACGVVAGTSFQLAKMAPGERFHYAVFDEAGQLPIPHALAGMVRAQRWLFFGDHAQLPPVIKAEHPDREVAVSVFEHLHGHYGGDLLRETYRMNDLVCSVIGETFYGGQLRSAPEAAGRRMPFRCGGAHDAVLDPERGVVLVEVDHRLPSVRSVAEAERVAELVGEIVGRHGVPAREIAVVAPFRAQVRQIRSALERRGIEGLESMAVDTVERIQGQEREVVLLSLAVGDPAALSDRSSFFFSTNRLNVALSRARTKALLVASPGAFAALPRDPDALAAASTFKRLRMRLLGSGT